MQERKTNFCDWSSDLGGAGGGGAMAANGEESVLVDDEVLRKSYSPSELRYLKTHVSSFGGVGNCFLG